jgi:Peptidase family S41/N-terminal domain of Peptidase_S41 in eukaryotic IRBP
MDEAEVARTVGQVCELVEAHYVFPDAAGEVSRVLAEGLAEGRYPADASSLAATVTADLQSVNGDKHLRLLYHDEALAQRAPGDDAEEYAAMARWAGQTCGGVACVQRLAGNVGYLDLQPVLFPAAICGENITAAMSLLADTDALVIDLRHCLGGEPAMTAFIISYLWDCEPAQLTGLRERKGDMLKQAWTLPHVPGRRFGKAKPVYVLTSASTFSGGEQLSYDLQQLGRASVIGERTRGGAHAREGFPVHQHLEATISVAEAVNPRTGGNWEGTGVMPDIQATAVHARRTAYRLALQAVIASGHPAAAEAEAALAATEAETARSAPAPG